MTGTQRQLRIQVTTSGGWGGRESLPLAIHRLWGSQGIPSILLGGKGTPLALRDGADVRSVPRGRLALARSVRRALNEVRQDSEGPPVLISHFTHDLPSLRWALRGFQNIRLVVVKHVSPGPPKTDWLHRWVYARVDCLLGVSEFVAEKCRIAYPIPSNRIGVWHPGVDTDEFAFREESRRRIRAEHGAKDSHAVIGYVGRVTPNKGLEELLTAFASLHPGYPDAYLWIVGGASDDEAAYEHGLRHWVDAHKLTTHVVFCGYRENVQDYMSALDVFVTPSREESFGLTTVEAMAAARPVVGFDIAGTGEIVRDGEAGILARPDGDAAMNLGVAIRSLLDDPDRSRMLGLAARERARNRFSHQQMLRRLESSIDA